jgi:hypothetical protein
VSKPTMFELVEAGESQVLPPLTCLLVTDETATPFGSSLSHRTTSRRRHSSEVAQDMTNAMKEKLGGVSEADESEESAEGVAPLQSHSPTASHTNGTHGPPASSNSLFSPTPTSAASSSTAPMRGISQDFSTQFVDSKARAADWYLVGKTREAVKRMVVALMKDGDAGHFIVREKQSVVGLSGEVVLLFLSPSIFLCPSFSSNSLRFDVGGYEQRARLCL